MKNQQRKTIGIERIFEIVYKKALNFLSYKERTSSELDGALDRYLSKYSISSEEKSQIKSDVIEEIAPTYVLSDEDYVKEYVEEVIRINKPMSRKQITRFLLRKGISGIKINEGIDAYYTSEIEEQFIRQLCDRRLVEYNSQEKAKIIRYLVLRGFSPWLVYAVVDTYFKRY